MKTSKLQWVMTTAVLLSFAVLLLFWGQCEVANKRAAYGRVHLVNYATTGWRVEFVHQETQRKREVQVPRDGEVRLPLAPGAYTITQILLDEDDNDWTSRVLSAEVAPRQSYVFRLVTLDSPVAEALEKAP